MTDLKEIVVAYDGSLHSKKALDWAVKFANDSKAAIDVVMVLVPSSLLVGVEDYAGGYFAEELKDFTKEEIARRLLEAQKHCETQGVRVLTKALYGNILDEILNYVAECRADMVICGTRGLGGFEGLLMGSVARKLVTYVPVPVMVVK